MFSGVRLLKVNKCTGQSIECWKWVRRRWWGNAGWGGFCVLCKPSNPSVCLFDGAK